MKDLMSFLFETNAFRVCEDNKPFIYTSGKIGPYYVNTHFLYGDETQAKNFLSFIDSQLENTPKDLIPHNLFEQVLKQYENNEIFKTVIDSLKDLIETKVDLDSIDYISGGERRDWFFSILIAYFLQKPHITLFKDLSAVVSTCDFEESTQVTSLVGKRILHIADLLTTASSYVRFWSPAIKALGSNIVTSAVVIDRMQGAGAVLSNLGIRSLALVQLDNSLFEKAKELQIINDTQLNMLNNYVAEPDESMKKFLIEHPEFLENAIKSPDAKTAKYAKACKEQNPYNL